MRSQSLDLETKEGELTDKMKLKQSQNKKFEFEKRLDIAKNIEPLKNLLAGKAKQNEKN